jgi:hypothetical protein
VIVKDRGHSVALLAPFSAAEQKTPFAMRTLVSGFKHLPTLAGDVTNWISEDRDRA